MKKIFYLLLLLPLQFVNSQIFEETFDTWPHKNWTIYHEGTNTTNTWELNSFYLALSGDSVIESSGTDIDNWLVLPAIRLNVNSFLSFEEYKMSPFGYNYNGIMISTASSVPSDGDFTELFEASENALEFTLRKVLLADYTGQTVYIAFLNTNDIDQIWFLDNIRVDTIPDIKDLALLKIPVEEYLLEKQDSIDLYVLNNGGDTINAGT